MYLGDNTGWIPEYTLDNVVVLLFRGVVLLRSGSGNSSWLHF